MQCGIGRVGRIGQCRWRGVPSFGFTGSNLAFQAALAEAANTGMALGFSGPNATPQYWLRGTKYSNFLGVPGATYTRTGSRAGADAAVVYAANVPRVAPSSGLRVFGSGTNLVRSSDAPPTQSFTVAATVHTLSLFGTGSITLSGAATGTLTGTGASNRVVLTFTPTAATLTLTVSGSVTFAQLEENSFATDYIPNPNTGASSSAGADDVQVAASALPTSGPILFLADLPADVVVGTGPRPFVWGMDVFLSSTTEVGARASAAGSTAVVSGLASGGARRIAVLYTPGAATRLSVNGSAVNVGTDVGDALPLGFPLYIGNNPALTRPLNRGLGVFAAYRATPSDAQLQAMSAL